MADVFLSYRNTRDRRAFVRRLAAVLRAHGLTVWWDYGLEAGESYRRQITEELSKAGVVIPLWCSESIRSKWVLMEAELGKDKLVPARLQAVAPPSDFESLHASSLIGWNGSVDSPALLDFVRNICARLGRPAYAPPDLLEELADLRELTPLPDPVTFASPVGPDSVLVDLRTTWTNFPALLNRDAVEEFLSRIRVVGKGSGLEFEVEQHLENLPVKIDSISSQSSDDSAAGTTTQQAFANVAPTPEHGGLIAVGSGKGGVGKTLVAVSLAACFARKGHRTLLVDANFTHANVDVQLGIAPETDIAAVIAGWVELEDAICGVNGGAGSATGFDVLPGRSGSGALAGLPAEDVARFAAAIRALGFQYDIVVVDLATGAEDTPMRIARACDHCLMVTTDEPCSMTDAYAFHKVLSGYAKHVSTQIVVNMVENPVFGIRTYEALARAIRTFHSKTPPELAGVVMRDPIVRQALKEQRTLASYYPDSLAAKGIAEMSEKLLPRLLQRVA